MSLFAIRWRIVCDTQGCRSELPDNDESPHAAVTAAEAAGWAVGIRRDGTPAARGGRTRCPKHRPAPRPQ